MTWDGTTFALDINGAAAPAAVITFMNQKWGGNDSEAYVVNYVKALGWTEETEAPTTEETTEEVTEETTTEPEADKSEATTEAPAGDSKDDKTEKGGCASAIGFSAIAMIVSVASCGLLTFRKKRD